MEQKENFGTSSDRHTTSLYVRQWSEGFKDIMLLHGILAHSYWWTWVVHDWHLVSRAVAPDFSGMGRSHWRKSYTMWDHIQEIGQLIPHPMWIIGHSYGGLIAYGLSVAFPDKIKGVIMVDSPLMAWNAHYTISESMPIFHARKYEDSDTMKKSFMLIPQQPFPCQDMKNDLFHHSIYQHRDGTFRWLFDPDMIKFLYANKDAGVLHNVSYCPMLYIAAEYSSFSQHDDRHHLFQYAQHIDYITLPNTHHAILLDAPQLLQKIITEWIMEQTVK